KRVAIFGICGVLHKQTTWMTGSYLKHENRAFPARSAGLQWGAYHWGTAANVLKQVDDFLKTAQPDDKTLVALDFEETPGNQMTLDQAREFLRGSPRSLD